MPSLNDLPASSSRQFDSSETSGKSATGLSLQERRGSAPQSHQQLSTDLSEHLPCKSQQLKFLLLKCVHLLLSSVEQACE